MALVINTFNIGTQLARNVDRFNSRLGSSVTRVSSGSRIVNPWDDAGGLSLSAKLDAAINRTSRTNQNVDNGISFTQVQAGALKEAQAIISRMSELKTMSLDVTKNNADIANYDAECTQLQYQLADISSLKFNDTALFTESKDDIRVVTTELGDSANSTP